MFIQQHPRDSVSPAAKAEFRPAPPPEDAPARNHDVLETNDAVVHHVVELDASLGERHLELSFQGAN